MGWLRAMVFPIQQGLFKLDVIDHYAILGVSVESDIATIRQRYLKIAYRLHPDTCKAETQVEKQRANELLSKLVNPAYEHLSREESRHEFRLIIGQIGKDFRKQFAEITLVGEHAKKLSQSNNIDLAYNKFLQSLTVDQYNTLDLIFQKIAQISELNLVYLVLAPEQTRKKVAQSATVMASINPTPVKPPTPPAEKVEESPITVYIRRAQDGMSRNNPSQVILEMKDALKIDPNNMTCHALLGLAYLQQNQTSMARVHINRAWNAKPNDPIVLQSKQALDIVIPPQDKNSPKDIPASSGSFWSRLGGKKKSSN